MKYEVRIGAVCLNKSSHKPLAKKFLNADS
mgnify:CR=1 FL=1